MNAYQKKFIRGGDRPQRISKLSFGILSAQDTMNVAELEITNKALFVLPTRRPAVGGVLDRHLGTSRRGETCDTCGKVTRLCPGHFGYIQLEMPCFHIGYFKHVVHILQCICKTCSRILLTVREQDVHRQKLSESLHDSRTQSNMFKELCGRCKRVKVCPHCNAPNGQVKKLAGTKSLKIVHDVYKKKKNDGVPFPDEREAFMKSFDAIKLKDALNFRKEFESNLKNVQDDLTPYRAHQLFLDIRDCDLKLLRMSPVSRPEWMIMTHIPVPPPCLRPSVYSDGGAGGSNEDDLTVCLQGIVNVNTALKAHIQKGASMKQIQDTFDGLQFCAAQYINSDLPGFPQTIKGGQEKQKRSLCQRLKGKAGRFRGNLSGKRVDFSARTVISPDPNLKITEVGVPYLIAMKLTYPETVNRYNIDRLKRAVRNGFYKYPGANYFESQHSPIPGYKLNLKYGNLDEHANHLAIGDVVERHLIDGDVVLFNRQPSLHKQSIMAHTVRVMNGRTFRFNECVCSPYNADFDGDEMNLHVPQTEEARAEALELMGVMNNICTPKNGSPLVSATQDFITSAFLLTQNGIFMNREEFCNIICYAGDGLEHINLPKPAIVWPVELWTGKQVINSMISPNHDTVKLINFEMKERNYKATRSLEITNSPYLCPNEGYTCFHNSELVCGNLTKSSLSGRGFFYAFERYHGSHSAANMMNRLTKMCTRWLTNRGFSIGIDDVTANRQLTEKKKILVDDGYRMCDERIAEYEAGTLELKAGCNLEQSLESELNKTLSTVRDTAGQMCMKNLPWYNSPRIMSVCGSKGSSLNICQMIAAVGQQTVNGSRTPDGFVNRSLPHFRCGAKHPKAKGFVANSFFTGLNAPEFFFHTMGGREGLVDTAVKTAKTGYMSRRLMKTLEDLSAQYDKTVRNSARAVIQFRYGDDGLHPVMMESGVAPVNLELLYNQVCSEGTHKLMRNENHSKKSNISFVEPKEMLYMASNALQEHFQLAFNFDVDEGTNDDTNLKEQEMEYPNYRFVKNLWEFIKDKARELTGRMEEYDMVDEYRITKEDFETFLNRSIKAFERAKVQPGEALGAVGAQSLGEPGTQMTLKTFHFAGVASMNITLGVPRINELMNASKKTSTPIITAQLDKSVACNKMAARIIKGRIEVTTLGQISKNISENISSNDYTVSVTLDMEAISNLHLELSVNDIMFRIEQEKRLQLKQKKNHQVIRTTEDSITIKLGVPLRKANDTNTATRSDLFFEAQRIKSILIDIPVAGFSSISRAVVSVVDRSEEQSFQNMDEAEAEQHKLVEEVKNATVNDINDVLQLNGTDDDVLMGDSDEHSGDSETSEKYQLICEGRGLLSVMGKSGVDGKRTISNDITEMFDVLGIEAARKSIQNEIGYVYQQYGLSIDPRHLMLLSDVMTYRGEILGINRFGIAKMKESVLMLASFEKTPDHLFDAAVSGAVDSIDGVSECIIMGTAIPLGTGVFKLLRDHSPKNDSSPSKPISKPPPPLFRNFP
jgi:DNA-directed RNA polymerase III subunit RPC1